MFESVEHFYNSVYLGELCFRLWVQRLAYFKCMSNVCDGLFVVASTIDAYILSHFEVNSRADLSFVRLIRMVRLVRVLRIVRTLKFFKQLRVLVKAVTSSCMALFWSMILLGIIMFMNSIFLVQVLAKGYLESAVTELHTENFNLATSTQLFVYEKWGTPSRAFYTSFELTFSGGWPAFTWRLVSEVSWWYAIYFSCYVFLVVFALMRVVTSLFLKETLQAAANDSDMMMQERLKETKELAQKLEVTFSKFDVSGDGTITRQEFYRSVRAPHVRDCLAQLGLSCVDFKALFELLDDGDGVVSYQEFSNNVVRLKGTARSQDVVAILHESKKLHSMVASCGRLLALIDERAEAESLLLQKCMSRFIEL